MDAPTSDIFILVSRGMKVLQAAPAAYPYRYSA